MNDNKLEGLHFKRKLAQSFVDMLDRMSLDELTKMGFTDEQRKSAMDEYKRQLAEIDRKITEITGTPPDIVIGLKTARLFGKSELN